MTYIPKRRKIPWYKTQATTGVFSILKVIQCYRVTPWFLSWRPTSCSVTETSIAVIWKADNSSRPSTMYGLPNPEAIHLAEISSKLWESHMASWDIPSFSRMSVCMYVCVCVCTPPFDLKAFEGQLPSLPATEKKKLGLLCFSKKFRIHPNESGFSKPFGICGLNMLPHHAHARIHGWRGWSFTTHLLGGAAPLFLGWWPGSWSNFAVKTPVKGAGGSSNHSKNWQFFVCRILRMWTKTATSNLNKHDRHVDIHKNATYYNFISDLVSKLCLNMDVVCIY